MTVLILDLLPCGFVFVQTNPQVPNILTTRSVTVLDFETGEPTTIRNPFGLYEYTVSTSREPAAGTMCALCAITLCAWVSMSR